MGKRRTCVVCGKPVTTKDIAMFTTDNLPICSACAFDMEKEYCEVCGTALSPDEVIVDDGRVLCAVCYADIIEGRILEKEGSF